MIQLLRLLILYKLSSFIMYVFLKNLTFSVPIGKIYTSIQKGACTCQKFRPSISSFVQKILSNRRQKHKLTKLHTNRFVCLFCYDFTCCQSLRTAADRYLHAEWRNPKESILSAGFQFYVPSFSSIFSQALVITMHRISICHEYFLEIVYLPSVCVLYSLIFS